MFPVVNKSILRENFEQIKVDPAKVPHQKGDCFIQRTSASTGTPFAVPQDTRKRNRIVAELKYFGEKSGFRSHTKLINLRNLGRCLQQSKLRSFRKNIIAFDISQINNEKLGQLCDTIINEKVETLRGYASTIDLLVRYIIENKRQFPSLKLMIATSEALPNATRELVLAHIGCNIISQYANQEKGFWRKKSKALNKGAPFFS